MNIFVTVLTLAAVFASSEAGPQGRITHGQIARERQFLFYVGIADYGIIYCGGAIISNYWVITSAHCVDEMPMVTLLIGSTNSSTPELTLTVPENCIKKHPDFHANSFNNDIALLNTTYIEFTYKIHKVSLPSMGGIPDVAREVLIAIGWGEDENREHDPHNLKYVYMRAMTREACQPFLEIDNTNSETTLCAMAEVGSICYGDSGGPIIMDSNKMLLGISSFVTNSSCAQGAPVGFTRVTEYLHWIKSVSGVYRA